MSVNVIILHNPFDRSNKTRYSEEWKGTYSIVSDYIGDSLIIREGEDISYAVNGRLVESDHLIKDGDGICVTVCMGVEGGVLSAIGTFVASHLAMEGTIWYTMAYYSAMFIAYVAFSYGMGLLLQELMAPDTPELSNVKESTTYGWGPLQQVEIPGSPIWIVFGTHKISGVTIGKSTDLSSDGKKEYLNYLLAACEGPVDSITDIRINDQPLSYYTNVRYDVRLGTLNDAPIDYFNEVNLLTQVGRKIVYHDLDLSPVTGSMYSIQTQGNAIKKVYIDLSGSKGLYFTNSEGKVGGLHVDGYIYYRKMGETNWNLRTPFEVNGNGSRDAIRKRITIELPSEDQWEFKIIRTNVDMTNGFNQHGLWWQGMTEIFKEDFIYPGIAKYAFRALATDQLSGSAPRVSCLVTRSTVQVYNPYTGTWQNKNASNPAWACYALLNTHGPIEEAYIDYDGFKEWADYCDEDISGPGEDPFPRHRINLVIDTVDSIWNTVQSVARLGRAGIIRRGRIYTPLVSSLQTTVDHLFTMGNIIEGSFSLSYMNSIDLSNAVEATYKDEDTDYETQGLVVMSSDAGPNDYAKKAAIDLRGITNRDRIINECAFRINQNRWLKRTVNFEAEIDSFPCAVGDLFYFQHEIPDYENGKSGRIIQAYNSGNVGHVQLDKEVILQPSTGYKMVLRIGDTNDLVEKTVAPVLIETTTDTLELTTEWETVPSQYDLYAFGITNNLVRTYRLISSSRSKDFTNKLTGIEYISDVFEDTSSVYVFPSWNPMYQEATEVFLNEILIYSKDAGYLSKVNVSWFPAVSVESNWVIWLEWLSTPSPAPSPTSSPATNSIQRIGQTTECNFSISSDYVLLGETYKVYVVAEGQGPVERSSNTATITILGKEAPPSDVTLFEGSFNTVSRAINFIWTEISDIDVSHYEIRMGGSSWETASEILTSTNDHASYFLEETVQDSVRFWIKAVDTSGNYSDNAAYYDVQIDTEKCDLDTPTGLTLYSESTINIDGTDYALLRAVWNNNAEISDDFHHYVIQLRDNYSTYVLESQSLENNFNWDVVPGRSYSVRVNAVSKGITMAITDWSAWVNKVAASDSTAPSIPTNIVLVGFINSIRLSWDHGNELDLSHFNVYRNTIDDYNTASRVGSGVSDFSENWSMYTDVPLDYQTYYYWITSIDYSGNESSPSSSVSGSKQKANTGDIIVGSITADLIAVNAVTATKIDVAYLSAISANLGDITAGTLQSSNWSTSAGSRFDLNNGVFYLGGSTDYKLGWDGSELYVDGSVHITGGPWGSETLISGGYINTSLLKVGTAQIEDASITTAKIVQEAVTSSKIANASITTAKIKDAAISNAKIKNASITTLKVGNWQITTPEATHTAGPKLLSSFYLKTYGDLTNVYQVAKLTINLPYSGYFQFTGSYHVFQWGTLVSDYIINCLKLDSDLIRSENIAKLYYPISGYVSPFSDHMSVTSGVMYVSSGTHTIFLGIQGTFARIEDIWITSVGWMR